MRVQSIWTAIQIGDPTGDGLLGLAVQMSLGEMHRVAEAHDFAQEIGTMAEALQNARHELAARLGAPFVVHRGDLAGGVLVLDNVDLGVLFGHDSGCIPRGNGTIS